MSLDGVNLGTAYGRVIIDASGVQEGMSKAKAFFESGIAGMSASLQSLGNNLSSIGSGLTMLTAPITAFGVTGVKSAMKFEDALKEIEVRAGLSAEEIERVKQKAMELGKETVYGPSQAAEAFLQLMTSGYSAEQAMIAIDTVMQGASATGSDLGYTADALTDIMAAFQVEVGDSADIMQTLVDATASSSATFPSLVQGFANVGPKAKAMGLSVRDTAAILAVFSENGIKGAEAGTQLKSMLTHMTSDTNKVRDMWDYLNISMYDAAGNARDLDDVIHDLNLSMADMSEQEKNEVVTTLAGSYGQLGLQALLAADGFGTMAAAMEGQAAIEDVAASKLSTMSGAIAYLRGSIEMLQINALTPLMENSLRPLVLQIAEIVNKVNEWIVANPELANRIVRVLAVVAGIGPAMFAAGKAVSAVAGILGGLGGIIGMLLSPIGLLVAAVAGMAWAFKHNFGGIRDAVMPVVETIQGRLGSLRDTAATVGRDIEDGLRIAFTGDFIDGSFGGAPEDSPIVSFWLGVNDVLTGIWANIRWVLNTLSPLFHEVGIFIGRIFENFDVRKALNILSTLWSLTNPLGLIVKFLQWIGVDFKAVFEDVIASLTTFFRTLNDGGDVFDGLRAVFGDSSFVDGVQGGFGGVANFISKKLIPALNELKAWFLDDALPTIVDFVKTTVIPMMQDWLQFIVNMWEIGKTALEKVATWFLDEALPAIVSLIQNALLPAIESWINWMKDVWNIVGPALERFANWFISEALPVILSFISEKLIPGIEKLIQTLVRVWNDVSPFLLSLLDWFINTGLPLIVDFIDSTAVPVIEFIIGLLVDMWEEIQPGLTELYNWFVVEALPQIIAFVEGPFTDGINGLISLIDGMWTILEPILNVMKDVFVAVFGFIVNNAIKALIDAVNGLIRTISAVWNVIAPAVEALKNGLSAAFNWIKDTIIAPLVSAINSIKDAWERVQAFFEGPGTKRLYDTIDANVANLPPEIAAQWQQAKTNAQGGSVGNLGALGAGFGGAINIPGRAGGGDVSAWMPYLVGERGPELFVPQTAGTVMPNQGLRDMAGGSRGPMFGPGSVVIHANSQAEGEAAAVGFEQRLGELLRAKG